MSLQGKIAIVTGGTAGLGRAIGRQFALDGATVVCASRSLPEQTDEVHGFGTLVYDQVDVRDAESVRGLIGRTVARHGRVDVLVANAGVMDVGKLEDLDAAAFADMLATNVVGTLHCIQAVVPTMREQGAGRIITLSSTIASRPSAGTGGYAATKCAVEALTRTAALELAPAGILVNCVAPGFMEDGMTRALIANERRWEKHRSHLALGRAGHPAEVANAAVFLASAGSTYVNGAVLAVDGGLTWP